LRHLQIEKPFVGPHRRARPLQPLLRTHPRYREDPILTMDVQRVNSTVHV
jgi:hypothetical protein